MEHYVGSGIYSSLGQVTLECRWYVVLYLGYEGDAIGYAVDAIDNKGAGAVKGALVTLIA